jgi:hypothetical protein
MTNHKSNHSIRNLYTQAYSYCLRKPTALLRSILEDIRAIDIRKQNSLESTRDLILMAGQTAHPSGEHPTFLNGSKILAVNPYIL